MHSFCWHPSHLSGSAAHQAAQAYAVAFSKGTAVSCLPSSQSTANGSELTYVSAGLHLEPWTLFLPFFISFSQTPMVLSQGASAVTYPHCTAKRKPRNPSWTTPAWQREVFLRRSKAGTGFLSRGMTSLCQKNTPGYMSFYQGLTCIRSRDWLCLSRKQGEGAALHKSWGHPG